MPALERGDFLPTFTTASSVGPRFDYETLGGIDHLLVFLGSARAPLGSRLVDTLVEMQPLLKRHDLYCFVVAGDPRDREDDRLRALIDRYVVLWDPDLAVHRAVGLTGPEPADGGRPSTALAAMLVRRNLRVEAGEPVAPVETFVERIERAIAARPPQSAPVTMGFQAPVLVVPEVFDRTFCRTLIDYYEARGGTPSGFMRDEDGQTRLIRNPDMKRREDVRITDERLRARLRRQLNARVVPEITKAFVYEATRIERFVIGCYDARDQGFFRMHRDNTQLGTAHRRFAVTVNLNAEEYEGGELWFPEYGPMHYKAPSGSAVVFSCSLLHEVRPVTAGRRYAFLPFLYDEEAAEIRRRNFGFIAQGDFDGAALENQGTG